MANDASAMDDTQDMDAVAADREQEPVSVPASAVEQLPDLGAGMGSA
jgi:hypothetical protein